MNVGTVPEPSTFTLLALMGTGAARPPRLAIAPLVDLDVVTGVTAKSENQQLGIAQTSTS